MSVSAKGIGSALNALREIRRNEQTITKAVLGGGTLQALTEHNVSGMEQSVVELQQTMIELNKDPAIAEVLQQIKDTAADTNRPEKAVVQEMRAGGKYEALQKEWQVAIKDNPSFDRFETVSRELSRRMERDQPRLGNTPEPLLQRYKNSIEDSMDCSQNIPSREAIDGKMLDTLYSKLETFMQPLQQVVDKHNAAAERNAVRTEENTGTPSMS